MAELPDPLVPPEVDLRDFPYMPLDVVRLRDCDLAATASGEEFRAAVLLWCASWHQNPAASLPDDDAILSALAGFGRVVKEWLKVKDGALRNWVKCSDGRLYHPTVAEKANEAWQAKKKQRDRTEAARNARLSARHKNTTTEYATKSVTGSVTEIVTSSKGREGKGRENSDNLPAQLPTAARPEPAGQSATAAPPDPGAAPEPMKSELDRVEAACRNALGDAQPQDLVIGPIVEIVREFGQERVSLALASEARRPRRKPIRTWRIWADIVREALAGAPAPQPASSASNPADFLEKRWRDALGRWREKGRYAEWDETLLGAKPNEPGCRIPDELLAEFCLTRVPYPQDDEAMA